MIQRDGVMEIMVAMAASKDEKLQIVSTEAIIHTASKKKHCLGVLSAGVPILKELYKSKNVTERVRVRALVGLCKFGCYGGTDASIRAFAEGSNIRLASEIRRFLLNAQKDADIRKWAAEGLGYLTLDADVKEALCEDEEALKAVIQTAKTMDTSMYYGYASIFVNLTNSYYKDEPPKELVDLARFAKQHVPEEHLKDAPEYVVKRVKLLLKLGVVTSLVFMSNKTDSNAVKELLSRTFLALTENEKDRGLIIQQGGAKACILLANNGNEEGKTQAAQALAKIAITNNPEIAFPGQRCLEVVRPLIQLLHVEKTGLQNFESLMALTNLAQVSDSVRNRIVKEKGIPAIENYLFEDHDMIRRAAAECMCNLIVNEEVFESHLRENDKVKLLTVLCGMEDPDLVQACAGTLAILSHNEIACKKITALKSWLETLQQMCLSERTQIQHRALYITGNMIACDKDIAIKIIESKLLEILMVLSKEAKDETIKELALKALHEAAEMKLIKPVAH
ncbi:protein unc-45 homolog B [Saccoglossus kowalevskii]